MPLIKHVLRYQYTNCFSFFFEENLSLASLSSNRCVNIISPPYPVFNQSLKDTDLLNWSFILDVLTTSVVQWRLCEDKSQLAETAISCKEDSKVKWHSYWLLLVLLYSSVSFKKFPVELHKCSHFLLFLCCRAMTTKWERLMTITLPISN